MLVPIIGLALLAIAFLRYVIGYAAGRVYGTFGPLAPGTLAMIAAVWVCVAGLYAVLGAAIVNLPT